MIAFSIMFLAGLVFWVGYLCWHSMTVFREAAALPRASRWARLAKWALRALVSGVAWPGIGVAASRCAPGGSFLAGQSGERLYLVGAGIDVVALAVAVALALAAPDVVAG